MINNDFFRFIEVIEASSPEELAFKLRSIRVTYQLNNVWSDGKKHFALINPGRPLPAKLKETLAESK